MLTLQHGRSLRVADDVVEIRAADGSLELRLRVTEDGIVLQLEAARISLKADQSIDLDCQTFNLNAESDVRIRGERVYIN